MMSFCWHGYIPWLCPHVDCHTKDRWPAPRFTICLKCKVVCVDLCTVHSNVLDHNGPFISFEEAAMRIIMES